MRALIALAALLALAAASAPQPECPEVVAVKMVQLGDGNVCSDVYFSNGAKQRWCIHPPGQEPAEPDDEGGPKLEL